MNFVLIKNLFDHVQLLLIECDWPWSNIVPYTLIILVYARVTTCELWIYHQDNCKPTAIPELVHNMNCHMILS